MYNFKHYLNFIGLPLIGRIEISEPTGFDGSSHSIKQEDGRFGRDVVKGNELIELTINKDHFELMDHSQILPDGVEFNYASQGYDYMLSELESKGWECEIEYILQKDGIDFVTGIIDAYTAIVQDGEIKFKTIQNTKREVIKRREDIYIDAFSNEDLDGNPIIPCATSNILLKAKSIQTESEWVTPEPFGFFVLADFFHYFNPAQQINKYEINNTLDWLDALTFHPFMGGNLNDVDANNYAIIQAVNDLSNIKVDISNFNYEFNFPIGANQRAVTQEFRLTWGFDALFPIGGHNFFTVVYTQFTPAGTNYIDNNDYTFTIPFVPAGAKVFLYFKIGVDTNFSNQFVTMSSMNVNVSATETGIDSVIKGVRLIDLMKHNILSSSGLPTVSTMYDVGGVHYDNFAFNGYLIAQMSDKPFINKFKDLMNVPREINGDYQINEDSVDVLHYNDFYANVEIGVFVELPDEENTSEFNKRYFLKQIDYKYDKSSFENNANENNTLDDVHTKAQYLFPSTKTDGILNIDIKHVRSSFLIEKQRKNFIFEKKATEYDDTLFILDVIPVVGTVTKQINRILNYYEGKIYSDGTFNWMLLGFEVGNVIYVNGTAVTVLAMTDLILTTNGNFGVNTSLLNISYNLYNVPYMSRGDEGFDVVNGVLNPINYSNLKYHIKRNLTYFYSYLAAGAKYLLGKEIKNTAFMVNDKLETKFPSDSELIVDKASIVINDIANSKILNPIIHNVIVFSEFEDATTLFERVQTDKGYIRVQTNENKVIKGYPMHAEYEWSTGKLTLKLEEKFQDDYVQITNVGDNIFIDGINYEGVSFNVNNNFVSLYDENDILISNIRTFEFIKINGVAFDDVDLFSDALITILTL